MILLLTAAVIWAAVGARIGRVLVRQASTVRVAIVIGVASIALITTLFLPDVAALVDRMSGSTSLRNGAVQALVALFAASTLTISEAARPLLPKTRFHCHKWSYYCVGLVLAAAGIVAKWPLGWWYVIGAALVAVPVAARSMRWTVLGRGIGIYTIGVLATAACAIDVIVRGGLPSAGLMMATSLIIAVGSVWILFEAWIRSVLVLFQIRELHALLVKRFPDVVADDSEHRTLILRASDHVAHVMDALYLQSAILDELVGAELGERDQPPGDVEKRAQSVARWLVDPSSEPQLHVDWIAPPTGLSAKRWVVRIAAEVG